MRLIATKFLIGVIWIYWVMTAACTLLVMSPVLATMATEDALKRFRRHRTLAAHRHRLRIARLAAAICCCIVILPFAVEGQELTIVAPEETKAAHDDRYWKRMADRIERYSFGLTAVSVEYIRCPEGICGVVMKLKSEWDSIPAESFAMRR